MILQRVLNIYEIEENNIFINPSQNNKSNKKIILIIKLLILRPPAIIDKLLIFILIALLSFNCRLIYINKKKNFKKN